MIPNKALERAQVRRLLAHAAVNRELAKLFPLDSNIFFKLPGRKGDAMGKVVDIQGKEDAPITAQLYTKRRQLVMVRIDEISYVVLPALHKQRFKP